MLDIDGLLPEPALTLKILPTYSPSREIEVLFPPQLSQIGVTCLLARRLEVVPKHRRGIDVNIQTKLINWPGRLRSYGPFFGMT